jgi:hypothetical protein
MLPTCYGSKSTVHEHFKRWNKTGVMAKIFRILVTEYRENVGIDAQCQYNFTISMVSLVYPIWITKKLSLQIRQRGHGEMCLTRGKMRIPHSHFDVFMPKKCTNHC